MTLFDPEIPAAPSESLVRVRMEVSYDGRGFHGFAENEGVSTVAGSLREAIERLTGHKVDITCAGRTDVGVHARGQVISFDMDSSKLTVEQLGYRVTRLLCPRVVVTDAVEAPAGFDARQWAIRRHYRYTIVNRSAPDPFLSGFSWHVPTQLDVGAMRLASDPLIGEQDFTSLCRRPKSKPGEEPVSLIRRIREISVISQADNIVEVRVSADAFCHQMIRSIVGMLVAAGLGKWRAGDVRGAILARDRNALPPIAPPDGLVLWQVDYGTGPKQR